MGATQEVEKQGRAKTWEMTSAVSASEKDNLPRLYLYYVLMQYKDLIDIGLDIYYLKVFRQFGRKCP